jgi:myo-inositol-1-phosphate synthase
VVGVGNCASSLVQGIAHYQNGGANEQIGLSHWDLGGYRPKDLRVVAAGTSTAARSGRTSPRDLRQAQLHCGVLRPCARERHDRADGSDARRPVRAYGRMGDDRTFLLADAPEPSREDVVETLRSTGADVLVNYLPVGSQEATEFYAECALEAKVAFVNCIPVFIGSDPVWAKRFEDAGCPSSATTSRRSLARPSSTAC